MIKTSKRLLSAALSVLTVLFAFYGVQINQRTSAAQTDWKFDLGANAQSGYVGVSATQGFNASLGYGFSNTAGVKNVSSSGRGALSDAVQFTDSKTTFNVNLPKGLYRVTVTLGDTNRTSIYMEGMMQIVNMTGNNAVDSILIPVTDGQLNINAAAGKPGYAYSISAIDITCISADTVLPKTVWLCGDSTVCNYYPIETSAQAGWGQVLSKYIDGSWNVRDMAASGQFAKGFVDAGQFAPIEYYGKPGDVYIISIGINDTNYSNETEYYNCVTDMTKRAMAKGMKVILVKQQGRNGDAQRNPLLTGRWFGGALDKIGAEQNVQVIDLFKLWQDYCISIGPDETTSLYMPNDGLHPNRQGAMKLAELASSAINWDSMDSADIAENVPYVFKNKNSGMYLHAEGALSGANVSQTESSILNNSTLWTVKKASDSGYYYIYSMLDKGQYLLDVTQGKTANGTNIEIYEDSNSDAQLFKFVANNDGSYCILTKTSKDKSCVEVKSALTDSGANVQEWEKNGHACQSWILEPISNALNSSEILIGDLNTDGIINIFDYILIKRLVNGFSLESYNWHNADLNSDGEVKLDDVVLMGKFLLTENESIEAAEKCSSFYYANEAAFSKGVLESSNAGFKKDSYVNLDNISGSFIHWNVTAPTDGNYFCSFSVANGSTANRTMKIEVNGGKEYWLQDFLSTGAWTTWNSIGIVLPLKKGLNDIRMTSNTDQGGPNIDTLYIEKTDEPIAETYSPGNNPGIDTPDGSTSIYIAGDSTVQTYSAKYAPQQGWGAYLGENLSESYTVKNHAIAGRSSKSFFDNGRLDTILSEMKSGDYLLVQFAINDADYTKSERYAPVSDKIPGDEGSYEYYISKYIEGALAKEGKPILVTTVLGLKAYNSSTKKFTGSYQNYCDAMKKLASHYNIPCIDLNSLMVDHYNKIGYDAAYKYHMCSTGSSDMTHFTEAGASAVAKLLADELKKIL